MQIKRKNKKQSNDLSMTMLHKQTFCYMKKFAKKTHMRGGKNKGLKLKSCSSLRSQLKALSGYNR